MQTINKPSVEEMNRVIAEFDGWQIQEKNWTESEKLQYHSNWGLLMPVVQKIKDIDCSANDDLQERIDGADLAIFKASIFATHKAIHRAVYDFIIWYSSTTPTEGAK